MLELICSVESCKATAQREHSPCCSSHSGMNLCCKHYCWSHFVEVDACSPELHPSVVTS